MAVPRLVGDVPSGRLYIQNMSSFFKIYWQWIAIGLVASGGVVLIGGKTALIVFVLVVISATLFIKPMWLMYLLVPSLFLEAEQFSIYFGNWRGRGYHFLIGVLVVRMVWEFISKRITPSAPSGHLPQGRSRRIPSREGVGGVSGLDKALIAFLSVQAVAILVSPDKMFSIKIWVLQVLLTLLFWCVRYFVKTSTEWKRLLNIFLISSVVEALIGFWQVFAFYLQKTTGIVVRWGEVFHAQILQFGRPYGTFVEADWYGAFMAIPLMMSVVLMAGAQSKKTRAVYGVLGMVFGIAVIISGVRAAWIAVIVASVVGVFVLRGTNGARTRRIGGRIPHPPPLLVKERGTTTPPSLPPQGGKMSHVLYGEYKHLVGLGSVCALVIVVLLAIASPTWVGQIGERFISIFNPSTWAHEPRVATTQKAFELIAQSPIIGHGPGSYKILGIVPDVDSSQYDYYGVYPYLTNYFLTVLHDSGIIGFAVFLWLLWEGVKFRARSYKGEGAAVVMGVVVLMIAYLITTGFWLGMTWFLFALLCTNSSRTRRIGGRMAHE
ncbi:MAG: hypothetical protein UV70_C0005G0085 [Parcubacteria group bacterium GW2011_GWA2_43_13]|nr:MAG: hypothetical protein UV70_C0005G0085 [Parcubacteria group bacterium GW2011_GWA2_43_13]